MKIKDMLNYGMEIYCRNGKFLDYRWIPVFLLRCLVHKKETDKMYVFFTANDMRKKALKLHYNLWAQITRQLFYKGSKAAERLSIILNSWSFIENLFNDQALKQIYFSTEDRDPKAREKYNGRLVLWKKFYEGNEPLSIEFGLIDGQMKEGCASISLFHGEDFVYHINFWLTTPDKKTGKPDAYIGAHQGSKEGLDTNRDLTKLLSGCRPKNFIFIALQEFLKILNINKLYAVTNYGFYANNHIRLDRKLKVSYDEFWTECGGKQTDDKRFYELPLDQIRKTYEEIPTKKRAYYRKRYELLDEMAIQMKECIEKSRRK